MIQNARLPTRESDSQEVSASGGRRLRGVSPPRGHPRMRGEHRQAGPTPAAVRGIIPACAGSTRPREGTERRPGGSTPHARGAPTRLPPSAADVRDHPRMRGEHNVALLMGVAKAGSSPHARGAPEGFELRILGAGIIPACAGSTPCATSHPASARDHPRMRGEHWVAQCIISISTGSSPHARGARRRRGARSGKPGIIPACAGGTRLLGLRRGRWGDHPRMRGEHKYTRLSVASSPGSSPHARGAPCLSLSARSARRIIPACAGSTPSPRALGLHERDHPRMRGEHSCLSGLLAWQGGSSPHARGAPERYTGKPIAVGIIPACAGSTYRRYHQQLRSRDHPRMRGEHFVFLSTLRRVKGSSPHARGAPFNAPTKAAAARIIPACAGSTS